MTSSKHIATTLCLFLLSFSQARAQSVYAQVSSKKVQVGVPFEYAVVISVNTNNFTPPNLKDFDIVGGPNQSSSIQYVNGAMSQQLIISYNLVAKKEGKFTIGAASVVSGGQKFETAPLVIEAVKGAVSPGQSGGGDPQAGSKVSGAELYIKTSASKNKCYLGEQVTIIQKVYCRYQIIGFQKFAQPTYDGFYSQAQESTSKGQLAMENVDGVNYYTYELFRTVAIANKTGKVDLTPVEGDVVIRRKSNAAPRNVWEQFFGSGGYEDIPVTTKSKPLQIEVMPLPEEGKPSGFSGAVGNFQSKVQVTRNELKANDALNLKMTISGKGNLKLLSPPVLTLPEGFESYEPKASESGMSKTFDYLIIPRSEGTFTLTGLDFSFFNLDTKKYVTLPAGDIVIKVLPPDPNSAGAQVYTSHNQVKATENDIRYIKKGDFLLSKEDSEFFNSGTHILLIICPVLGLLTGLFIRRNHLRNNSNAALVKERKAAKMARKQLAKAEQLMAENNKDAFYTEVLTALNNYLSNKLMIPVADLSRDNIQKVLTQKQVDAGTLQKLLSTLDTSEYAKYAPGAVSGDLKTVYADTVSLIAAIEEQLNKRNA